MEFNEYQDKANRTLYGNEQVLTNCALGLAGESGQLIDLIKDYTFKGKKLDQQQMIHEMGDVLCIFRKLHSGLTFLLMKLLRITSKP